MKESRKTLILARALRVTSFVGLIIGFFNVLSFFVMPGYSLWLLILHTPLIFISLYGLMLPMMVKAASSQT